MFYLEENFCEILNLNSWEFRKYLPYIGILLILHAKHKKTNVNGFNDIYMNIVVFAM